jgi:hypothetical protein
MALGQRRSGRRSRTVDALFGSALAALLIGAALFGEPGPARQLSHPVTYGAVQGNGLAHAARPTHCRSRIVPACIKGHCAPLQLHCGH